MNQGHRRLARLAPRCAGFLLCLLPAAAPAVDWSGSGGNGNWSTAANRAGGVAPPSANTTVVTFGAAGTMFVNAGVLQPGDGAFERGGGRGADPGASGRRSRA